MTTTFWIQFIGVLFGIVMMYFTFVKFKRKELTPITTIIWFVIWVGLLAVAIIPGILDPIIAPLNFYRRLDFFVVFGFFVLLGLGFYNYGMVRKMERKLEQFVRDDALKEVKSGTPDSKTNENKEP